MAFTDPASIADCARSASMPCNEATRTHDGAFHGIRMTTMTRCSAARIAQQCPSLRRHDPDQVQRVFAWVSTRVSAGISPAPLGTGKLWHRMIGGARSCWLRKRAVTGMVPALEQNPVDLDHAAGGKPWTRPTLSTAFPVEVGNRCGSSRLRASFRPVRIPDISAALRRVRNSGNATVRASGSMTRKGWPKSGGKRSGITYARPAWRRPWRLP